MQSEVGGRHGAPPPGVVPPPPPAALGGGLARPGSGSWAAGQGPWHSDGWSGGRPSDGTNGVRSTGSGALPPPPPPAPAPAAAAKPLPAVVLPTSIPRGSKLHLCKFHTLGQCTKADRCGYSHTEEDARLAKASGGETLGLPQSVPVLSAVTLDADTWGKAGTRDRAKDQGGPDSWSTSGSKDRSKGLGKSHPYHGGKDFGWEKGCKKSKKGKGG